MTEEEIRNEIIVRGLSEIELNRLFECRMQIVNLKKEVIDILERNIDKLKEKEASDILENKQESLNEKEGG